MNDSINLVTHIPELHRCTDFESIAEWLEMNQSTVGFVIRDAYFYDIEYVDSLQAFVTFMRWSRGETLLTPANRASMLSKLGIKTFNVSYFMEKEKKSFYLCNAIMRSDDWPALSVAYAMRKAEVE